MTVHFIGAGPGAPDLITIRGRDLIASSPVCLFAGSLVPKALLSHCPAGAKIVDTAPMSLDMIIAEIEAAHAAGHDVARLHSGDLSVWSAMGEQLRRLPDETERDLHEVPFPLPTFYIEQTFARRIIDRVLLVRAVVRDLAKSGTIT